ncbi:WD domain containing protein, partial [Entamoeba invadens IP1]
MVFNKSDHLSVCGIHEAHKKSKEYEYLPSPPMIKTPHLILCCCLNIGIDPPLNGLVKPNISSSIYGWINVKDHKKREIGYEISIQLANQYQRYCTPTVSTEPLWDPTPEIVKKSCLAARERFGRDRVLFHYNGHGVPLPTLNHECWFFDENITTYVPMNISHIYDCLGDRAVYVLDCPYSQRLFKWFTKRNEKLKKMQKKEAEYIVFSGYGNLQKPQTNPNYPIDIFTACLTTPLSMCFLDYYYSNDNIISLPSNFLKILPVDHKTKIQPFSELYAILTSITEAIAWDVLTPEMFLKLFRQDIAVASLFRHFILATRIMKKFNYTPQSYPALPDTSNHPLWSLWDSVLELAIPKFVMVQKTVNYVPSPFFSNLIVSMKSWLLTYPDKPSNPCPLPMLFRLFLRKDYTVEVFSMLCEYVDLGYFACERVVNIGFIPLLVQSLDKEGLQQFGVFCLAKLFSYDSSKIGQYLHGSLEALMKIATKAKEANELVCSLFLLAQVFLDKNIVNQLNTKSVVYDALFAISRNDNSMVKIWAIVCFARLVDHEGVKSDVYNLPQFQPMLQELSQDDSPLVRSAVVYLLMYSIPTPLADKSKKMLDELHPKVCELAKDACPTVRSLLVVLIYHVFVMGHQTSKYQEVLFYLSNDTDPDVIRAAEGLLSLCEKSRIQKPFGRKTMTSPLEQFAKASLRIFDDLLERFYCSVRDVFRRPLLFKIVNEEKDSRQEYFLSQTRAVQSVSRISYMEIPNKILKEETRITFGTSLHVPKCVLYHPTLPCVLADISKDTIGVFEYKVSQTETSDFSNYNPINTSVKYLDWLDKSDAYLVSGCGDGSVRLWNNWDYKPKLITSWRGIPKPVVSQAVFSTMTNHRVISGDGESVFVWDVESEKCLENYEIPSGVSCLSQFSDKSFFCGGVSGGVSIVDMRCKTVNEWKDQKERIIDIGYSTRAYT